MNMTWMMMTMMIAMMTMRTWPEEGRRMPMLARVRRAGGREINLVKIAIITVIKMMMMMMMMMMTIGRWGAEAEDSALLVWTGRTRRPKVVIITMRMMMMMSRLMKKRTIQMGPRWRARMTITAVFQWPSEAKT